MVEEMGQNEEPAAKAATDEPDWPLIRRDYEESALTLDEIAARQGVSKGQISYRARVEGWKPRFLRELDRSLLPRRLLAILGQQIIKFEKQMKSRIRNGEEIDGKDVTLLNTMARTLDKLIELDEREKGAQPGRKRPEAEHLRKQLVQRISELARR
jgi:predicted RNA-binding protein with PUA domain